MTTTPPPKEELLPCPFCGDKNPLQLGNMYEERYSFKCTSCKCISPSYRTLPEAILGWNTRPIPPSSPNLEQLARECADKIIFLGATGGDGKYKLVLKALTTATAGMVLRKIHCPCCGRVARQDANSFECDHCQKCFPKGHGHEGIPWVLIEQLQTQLAEAQQKIDEQGRGIIDAAHRLATAESKVAEAQKVLLHMRKREVGFGHSGQHKQGQCADCDQVQMIDATMRITKNDSGQDIILSETELPEFPTDSAIQQQKGSEK